jgi:hypothetical protein
MNRCTPQHLGFVSSSSSSSASTASEGNGHMQPAAAVRLHFVLHLPSCAKAVLCAAKNLWLKANVSQITHAANFISKTDMCMYLGLRTPRVAADNQPPEVPTIQKPPKAAWSPIYPHPFSSPPVEEEEEHGPRPSRAGIQIRNQCSLPSFPAFCTPAAGMYVCRREGPPRADPCACM